MDFKHVPVLFAETIQALQCKPGGVYVDCTLGGAGHSSEIAQRIGADGLLIGIDQDEQAIAAARGRLQDFPCRIELVHSNFKDIKQVAEKLNIAQVDGILMDLGVSSYQLDTPERGFSYNHDAALDMRMDTTVAFSAYDLVNSASKSELTRIIREYGEEKWAARIAGFIVAVREKNSIATTGQLVEVIKQAVPASARRTGPHPAKRTFQALRIAVNDELGILENAIRDAVTLLKPGGRLCIITFHSLEDRICKKTFQALAVRCTCPPRLPTCICNTKPAVMVVGKPISSGDIELEDNPRARSAKLRVAEKLA